MRGNYETENEVFSMRLRFLTIRVIGEYDKGYIVGADGSGLRQLPRTGDNVHALVWSSDQKSVYVSADEKGGTIPTVWKWSVEGSNPEKILDNCCTLWGAVPGGQYLLGVVFSGEKTGIYELSISDKKCTLLVPGVTSGVTSARDGKSFLYGIASRGEFTIYRQPWMDGRVIGTPQVALKLPFTFPAGQWNGSSYDFSTRPFHNRLCASRRSRGPLSSEPEMSPTPDGRMVHTYAMQGDTAKAKAAYQDFLTLWKDADPDIPIFIAAKSEYGKLQ